MAVKGKSMLTEEIGLNAALEAAGMETIETDLGEYIVQLAGEPSATSSPRPFTRTGRRSVVFLRINSAFLIRTTRPR